jgi:hypothetical protein
LRTNRQRETSVDVVDLDLAGSTRLVYSLLEQNFQVAVNPSTLPKQHRDIDWPSLITAHPGIDNSATQALEALQKEFNKPIQVVAQARKNVAPLWTQALPWPTQTPSPRQIEGAGQVFDQSQAPAAPWPVAPTPPDAGYDARTQWIEGQNEARLQAYAQQQAARQAVPLQASQPRNAYGWLAQRIGNVFSSAAYAAPVPQRPVSPAPPSLPSKAELNERMRLIEDVLGRRMFDKHDYDYPYEQDSTGKKLVIDSKISYGTQIIRAGILKQYSNDVTKYEFSPQEKEKLRQKLKEGFTREEQQLLAKAIPLNSLLLRTDLNDAEKTAKGIAFLARINTDHTGKLDTKQLTADLKTYFIDQDPNFIGIGARALAGVGNCPIAYVLFGGRRVGAEGWKPELYDEPGNPKPNQAHHLAMFISEGMNKSRSLAETEAWVIDGISLKKYGINFDARNENDLILSQIGIEIGKILSEGKTSVADLEKIILDAIQD